MSPRFLPLALAVAALAATGPPASAHEQTTPEGVPIPKLDWRDCEDGFQCATAEVPRDYSRPRGPKVRLAVIRRQALDPEHRIGSMFLNPGGPGGSAVDFVRTAPPAAFELVSKFDVVGFDPRGVGDSSPAIDCDEPSPYTAMTPDTLEVSALLKRGRELARACLNRDPAFLASVNTANTARDMDVLRAAVGDQKLTYVGFSAGGMLGATYTSLFPSRARALYLDSPIDSDVWLNEPLQASREQVVSFEASLRRFFASCSAHHDACGFGGDDVETDFDRLVETLDAAPIDLGDGRRFNGQLLQGIAAELLYDRGGWPVIAQMLRAARDGDVVTLRELAGIVDNKPYELLYDNFSTYNHVERRYPHRLDPYLQEGEHAFAVAPHFAAGVYEDVSNLFWPAKERGAFYGPFRHAAGSTPALVIHGTHDPATPYAWGKRVVKDLGNARLVTYHGDGHGVLGSLEPCPVGYFLAYVEDLEVPPAGASCTQAPGPWNVAASSASKSRMSSATRLAPWRGHAVERR